jgi:hypothetical protein
MPGKGSTHCDSANAFPESRNLLSNSVILSERSESKDPYSGSNPSQLVITSEARDLLLLTTGN